MSAAWNTGGRGTLKRWLYGGGMAVVVLTLAIAAASVLVLQRLSQDMESRLSHLRTSSEIGTALESLILNQIAAGERYLVTPEAQFAQAFSRYGLQAHESRRRYKDLQNLSTAEQQQIAAIEQSHQRIEVEYALAHAQIDVGDRDAALRRVAAVRPQTHELEQSIRAISAAQTQKVTEAASELARKVELWQLGLTLGGLLAAALTGGLIYL
ncbi:MAG: hypothetical protein KY444_12655, partial [Gemmatimonadetes bacterium]|nr:hypothetical protein [Gemmatimonadota bacterium]